MLQSIPITSLGAIVVTMIACYTDVRSGKIYNMLTFPAAIVGIILRGVEYALHNPQNAVNAGLTGAGNGVLGWITGVAIMTFFKMFMKHMGHGDSKLMAAIGAFVGPTLVALVWMWYAFAYFIYFLGAKALVMPWSKVLPALGTKNYALITEDERWKEAVGKVIPVAPIIAAGLVLAVVLEAPSRKFLGW